MTPDEKLYIVAQAFAALPLRDRPRLVEHVFTHYCALCWRRKTNCRCPYQPHKAAA